MNSTHKLLTAMVCLQAMTLLSMWLGQPAGAGGPSFNSVAQAQMPDAGSQRAAMLDELKGMRADLKTIAADLKNASTDNRVQAARLEKMTALLESGRLQVRVVSPDDNKRPAPGR